MMRLLRDFRLLPVLLIAAGALLALKVAGLMREGHYALGEDADITGSVAMRPLPASSARTRGKPSWAQEMFGYPDVTGSVGESKPTEKPPTAEAAKVTVAKPVQPAKATADGTAVPLDGTRRPSPAEQALLERLHERRSELDARMRELEMRESLLKAAEKRLESRVAELKDLEARVTSAEQQKQDADTARLKNLITMYENMKAKDAAKIFDRLDIKVLIEVTSKINPRRMSDILAQMSPEAAERLTIALAALAAGKDNVKTPADLPKIEGRPNPN
jgi:flagellar motility protein MotE (MotC chaperone)